MNRLPRAFYQQDTIDVARELLGQTLVHTLVDGTRLSGTIVESEAYLGVEDPAAHSFRGKPTARTQAMFGEAGHAYIYFVYGMHFCMNVVTARPGVAEAVLLRALAPREGLARMHARKPGLKDHQLANGPGKLCRALELDRAHNGLDLVRGPNLGIEPGGAITNHDVIEGPRVGIGYAEDAIHWPLRFGLRGHHALSPPKFLAPES